MFDFYFILIIYLYFCSVSGVEKKACSDLFSNSFVSIHADIQHIADKLGMIINKLDAEFLKLQADGAATEPETLKEVNTSEDLTTEDSYQNTTAALKDDSGQRMDVADGGDGHSAKLFPDLQNESHPTSRSSDCNDLKGNEEELVQSSEEINSQSFSPHSVEEGAERVKGNKEKNSRWVIVG